MIYKGESGYMLEGKEMIYWKAIIYKGRYHDTGREDDIIRKGRMLILRS